MKDVTFGVKVPEDLRDEINEIMKASGLVGREFMQELVDSYRLDHHKQEIPEMSEEIKELQSLTHRINEMYLYLGTRFQDRMSLSEEEKSDISQGIDQEKKKYEQEIEKYKEKIQALEEKGLKMEEALNRAKGMNEEANAKINELTEYNKNYKELHGEYKNNIEALREQVSSLNFLKEDNEELAAGKQKLQENNDHLASELWFAKREVEKLSSQLLKDKEDYASYTSRLKEQHHLEKQTSILELQLENQKAIEALNSRAASMQTEYNDKLKQLLFDIKNKDLEEDKNENRNHTTN